MPSYAGLAIESNIVLPGLEEYRQRHIQHPGKVVPLHTTLTGLRDPEVNDEVEARIRFTCAEVPAFEYQAVCVNAFPAPFILWLAPMPVGHFENLVSHLWNALDQSSGPWPFPTFHMTIALSKSREEMYDALAEFQEQFGTSLPLKLRAIDVSLWLGDGESYWRHSRYPLG